MVQSHPVPKITPGHFFEELASQERQGRAEKIPGGNFPPRGAGPQWCVARYWPDSSLTFFCMASK